MSIYNSTTLPNISYANTFGDWVVATNNLITDHDQFAANNYQKNTGTLYLNDPTLGLQVNSASIFAGNVQVVGAGSSAYIQNNLRVDTQVYFTNTSLGLTNSGQANIGGLLLALGSGTGLAVSNNATIGGTVSIGSTASIGSSATIGGSATVGGTITVTGQSNLNGNTVVSNTMSVSGNTNLGNYLNVTKDISAVNGALSGNMGVGGTLSVGGSATFNTIQTTGQLAVGGNFVLNGTTVYNSNSFTINAQSSVGLNSTFNVNRGSSGANASILWNESAQQWQILDVNNSTYYRILSNENIVDGFTSTSGTNLASARTANVTYSLVTQAPNTFNGTTGTALPSAGVINFGSNNGVIISGTGNNLYINTNQDVRSTATPTFAAMTLTTGLPITSGGTGATSQGQALTNILPTGTTAGYVLTTGGPGNFYWAAGGSGGGGGATPGTTISSTYTEYTANGSANTYTTPVYVPGADQLKVYLDGVRQHPGQYTEVSGNTGGSGIVSFTSVIPSGVTILTEVDGYIINPYYANNISYTVNSFISSSANTIQSAIDGLSTIVQNFDSNFSTNTYTTSSTTQVAVDTFSTSTYRSAKYQVQMTSGSNYHVIELSVVHDGTTAYLSQYGEIVTNNNLGSFDASISGGVLSLLFTPNYSVTVVKFIRSNITI